jgi:hypothetical protein
MVHGGTNFGFYSGANTGAGVSDYQPDITSYDYVSTCELLLGMLLTLFYIVDYSAGKNTQATSERGETSLG